MDEYAKRHREAMEDTFLESRKKIQITTPCNLGPIKTKTIYFPLVGTLRASKPDGAMKPSGQKEDCPFNEEEIRKRGPFRNLISREDAEYSVEKGWSVFCWDYCSRTDCSSYIKYRQS
ncbi:MAG: hypothetical protein KJ592_02345 [Nanoarchaeota archaeon]|nr:hypothetical protein [Nanoarchaeota archaeon]